MPLDSAQLTEIQHDADEINRELRRIVWNGQLMAHVRGRGDALRLEAVLNQVNVAGFRTRERVNIAVRDLYRTSLARIVVNDPSRHGDGVVLRVRSERDPRMPALGLRVDDVLSVLEVEASRMQEAPLAGRPVRPGTPARGGTAARDGPRFMPNSTSRFSQTGTGDPIHG